MIKEACVENFSHIPKMIAAGADRIELNNDLASGGTTPSFGVMKKAVEYCHRHGVPVVVMIRPRSGNFVYDKDEISIMVTDIQTAGLLGVDAVAFGCLTGNNQLNKTQMQRLISLAQLLEVDTVMHMAFDEIPEKDQKAAINWLAKYGVKRILTHGGSLDETIFATMPHLKKIMVGAKNKIEILPGGGINVKNRDEVAKALGVPQLHGSKIVVNQ